MAKAPKHGATPEWKVSIAASTSPEPTTPLAPTPAPSTRAARETNPPRHNAGAEAKEGVDVLRTCADIGCGVGWSASHACGCDDMCGSLPFVRVLEFVGRWPGATAEGWRRA